MEDAIDAASWYARQSTLARAAFLEELRRAQREIIEAPERQPEIYSGCRRFLMRRFPYKIIYQALPDRVRIIAIAHVRRRPFYWRHRR